MVAELSLALFLLTGCSPKAPTNDPELARFLKARETQARGLVQQNGLKMPAQAWSLFDYLQTDKWSNATNAFAQLQGQSGRSGVPVPPSPLQAVIGTIQQAGQKIGLPPPKSSALQDTPWHAIVDAHWAYVLSKTWRGEPLGLITKEILNAVPPGAIFFGDSDPGRFAMSRVMESLDSDKRFYVITQNQLADYSYWAYADFLSGTNITMPGADDFNAVYSQYLTGAYGTGRVAVAAMNAEFSELIFHKNPGHRVYMESSWFLPKWAYDRCLPRGPVFEISRQPVPRLEEASLEDDRAFWSAVCKKLLGDVIGRGTSVGDVCEFVEARYLRSDMSAFKGHHNYVSDTLAQNWFGMARHTTAALYQWRCIQAKVNEEKQRMLDESMLAYKQTFALSPLTSMDFCDLLSQVGRTNEATRILSVREKIAARR